MDPGHRVGLACYNETHAQGFGAVLRNLMQTPEYRELFPDPGVRLPKTAAQGAFSTVARAAQRDAQPSFLAMGLVSGFTGKGVDTLIIDDPYASAEEARSEAINDRVWRWWSQTAGVRIGEDANVVVMFHRYHEDDFAGRLLASGRWEYLRFPAIADENEDGSDPTGRVAGELLSPIRSLIWLREREAEDPQTFLGQFQGRPRPPEGAFFKRDWLLSVPAEEVPPIGLWVRFWDLATKADQTGDWTAGALVGVAADQTIYLRDVTRFREEWPDACETVVAVTASDSLWAQKVGVRYEVGLEKVAWMRPMIQDLFRKAIFGRVALHPIPAKGDKKERASGWAARARYDKFRIVQGAWDVRAFISEALAFDGLGLAHDDQIDAVSGAYELVWALRGGARSEEKQVKPGTFEYYQRLAESQRDSG
jgi:predicted phage terminase large subunit-like protein